MTKPRDDLPRLHKGVSVSPLMQRLLSMQQPKKWLLSGVIELEFKVEMLTSANQRHAAQMAAATQRQAAKSRSAAYRVSVADKRADEAATRLAEAKTRMHELEHRVSQLTYLHKQNLADETATLQNAVNDLSTKLTASERMIRSLRDELAQPERVVRVLRQT